jgi:release factor glutamine methyltransferase
MNSFNFKDLQIYTHKEVYEPSEDTFLLLDSVDIKKNERFFEIGTGTGIISLYLAKKGHDGVCCDINPIAVELVKKNYLANQSKLYGSIDIRLGDMFEVLNFNEKFDVIIFNPPYLPTKPEEYIHGSGWFDKAVSGGLDGLSLTSVFIEKTSVFLKEKGRAYFIFSSLSDENKLCSILNKNNLEYKIVSKNSFDDETLFVYMIKN